jgi:2-dehydropantoate 2-reductase
MRHAVLGAGGVGGLLAVALGRSGVEVVALMREPTLSSYPGRIIIEGKVLGSFTVEVSAVWKLDRAVDVVWVTAKSTGLEPALAFASPDRVGGGTVVPLLEAVDHLVLLGTRYPAVVEGTLRGETERVDDGYIVHKSGVIRIDIVGEEAIANDVRATGIDCRVADEEPTLIWQKMVFLAPLALATTGADGPLGVVRDTELYQQAQSETVAVAQADGAQIDLEALQQLSVTASDEMRSSMQRDIDAGRTLELDAIAGPILRGRRTHGIETPATAELAGRMAARVTAGARASRDRDTS